MISSHVPETEGDSKGTETVEAEGMKKMKYRVGEGGTGKEMCVKLLFFLVNKKWMI